MANVKVEQTLGELLTEIFDPLADPMDPIVEMVAEFAQNQRHPGSGRILKFEELNESTAAVHAVAPDVYKNDPLALRRYLKELGIDLQTGFEEQVLWEMVSEELKKPANEDSWLLEPDETVAYLRREIPKGAKKLHDKYLKDGRSLTPKEIDQRKKSDKKYKPEPPGGIRGAQFDPAPLFYLPTREQKRFFAEVRTLLPPKQYRVLRFLYAGLTNKEIAESLGVTESTVRDHAKAVRENGEIKALLDLWLGKSERNPAKTRRYA